MCRLMQIAWKACPHIKAIESSPCKGAMQHRQSTPSAMRCAHTRNSRRSKHSCDTGAETDAAMQVGSIALVRSRMAPVHVNEHIHAITRANQPVGQPFNTDQPGLPGDFGRWGLPRDFDDDDMLVMMMMFIIAMMMLMDDLEEGSLPVHRGTQMEETSHSLDAVSPSPPHTTTTHQPTHRAISQGKHDDDDD